MTNMPKEIHAARGYTDANEGVWNGIHAINGQTLKPTEDETAYIRADHVDALLKAEREKALREAAKVAKKAWHDPICEADDRHIPHLILTLIQEDATDG